MQFLISCNVALIAGLHQLYDNNFFSVIVKKIIEKLHQVKGSLFKKSDSGKGLISDDELENDYRKMRNIILIFANLYIFDSISCDFIKSLIEFLCKNINDNVLELTLLLIQNTGSKIRSDNPRILKELITLIKESSDQYTKLNNFQTKKQDFILQTLNEINGRELPKDTIQHLLSLKSQNFNLFYRFCKFLLSFPLKYLQK